MSRHHDGPGLYVKFRTDRDVMLVRGRWAQTVTHQVAPEDSPPQWSDYGRGWCLPARCLHDVLAYAQEQRWLAVLSDETPATRTEASA